MTKRSAAITELENQLRDMISPNGGLLGIRWVGRYVELMRETANSDGKDYLLKVLFNTSQTEQALLSRFIQLNGIEILNNWLNEHSISSEQNDNQIIHSCLSCLNKLTLNIELLDKTQIGKTVQKLAKHPDASIQAKANTIVSKWKKMATEKEDSSKPSKIKPRPIAQKKIKTPEVFNTLDKQEEVYIPQSPLPDLIEIMPNNQYQLTESTSSTKKIVRYFNTLYELRLIVIDGLIKIALKKLNTFGELMNPMLNAHY
ncbi:hypothetical protein SteCoe_18255 [Stentor coeruleus]|uniref:TFIIS N-terminal domain-containing protein n=1 Tax=Stentor coeruleus TaxID=5963 RepID=A0A1R2BXA7_9CILI|nr:hypothetical protein SteCoe_18255 [Stentor coeruleus]